MSPFDHDAGCTFLLLEKNDPKNIRKKLSSSSLKIVEIWPYPSVTEVVGFKDGRLKWIIKLTNLYARGLKEFHPTHCVGQVRPSRFNISH